MEKIPLHRTVSSWGRLINPKYILQHDNDPKHTTSDTMNCQWQEEPTQTTDSPSRKPEENWWS